MNRYYVEYSERTTTKVIVDGDNETEARENFWQTYNYGLPFYEVAVDASGPQNIKAWEFDGAG